MFTLHSNQPALIGLPHATSPPPLPLPTHTHERIRAGTPVKDAICSHSNPIPNKQPHVGTRTHARMETYIGKRTQSLAKKAS